jgi:hypothetical protein
MSNTQFHLFQVGEVAAAGKEKGEVRLRKEPTSKRTSDLRARKERASKRCRRFSAERIVGSLLRETPHSAASLG